MKKLIKTTFDRLGYSVARTSDATPIFQKYNNIYEEFKDFTMIPKEIFIDNLRLAEVFAADIKGDIVECGVWRGGMSAALATLFNGARKHYLFDSFEGLPEAKEIDGVEALEWQKNPSGDFYYDNCKAEIDFAKSAMDRAKSKYELIKGWFSDTMPKFKMDSEIAVLRLDADWYDSTMDCLKYLYPLVAKNGLILIDDYYAWDGCSRAVHDYLSSIKSASRIFSSPAGVCYIIKKEAE